MAILLYITKLILASGLLFGYYYLFLRNKQFHRYNRAYLLVAPVVALVIPFFNVPVNFFAGNNNGVIIKTLKVITIGSWEEPVTIYANRNSWSQFFTLQYGLTFLYVAGVVTGFFLLLRSLAYIRRIKKEYTFQAIGDIKFYNTDEKGTPFSFFRLIFWNNQVAFNSSQGQQIFRHELFHVKEKHSSDILFMELLTSIAWFNPFFHLMKKEIKAIHEFLADEYAVSGNSRYEYAELLVIHAINQRTASLTNHFFHHQIKRRIAMITSSNPTNRKSGYLRRVMVLPLLFIVFCAFAVKLTGKKNMGKAHAITTPITIVVDAGHGGIYPGAQSKSGIAEKDINLGIARMMKELSREYNINVVMTRSNDELVGDATTLVEDLQNRVDISKNAKPDLFISIHVNAATGDNTSKSGFEAYISGKKEDKKSVEWASVLLTGLKSVYPAAETVRQNASGTITVLDKNTCPAVLIECGYITNTADVAFISNQKNQEKVARNILESIAKFRQTEQPAISVNASPAAATGMVDELAPVAMESFSSQNNPQDSILSKVEIEAAYPGGKTAWSGYLSKNIHYPQIAIDKEIKGTVIVQFVVDKEGTVSNVKAISGPKELRDESVRVVKVSGKWEPGVQHGKRVTTYKKQPIIFQLEVSEPAKTGKS